MVTKKLKNEEPTMLMVGERNYRVRKEKLNQIEHSSLSQFVKHLIQEGIKQILFAQGSEQMMYSDPVQGTYTISKVPDEMIKFLLDQEVIELDKV